jgi:hypothetical protein
MMSTLTKCLMAWVCLLIAVPAFAADKPGKAARSPSTKAKKATRGVPQLSATERYALRCQSRAPDRTVWPQGTLLWGTLDHLQQGDAGVKGLRLEAGHLVTVSAAERAEAPHPSAGVVGAVLEGAASDGTPVEVAICGAEPAADDREMVWYRLEYWNAVSQQWANPCVATGRVPDPRALAIGGAWDARGAHRDVAGKITFACENGAITKCVRWGYKPWASQNGKPLAETHQACTRMARADYCGNGQSHTREETAIDMYDHLGVLARATEATGDWDPARASFEAAWSPDGAHCMARTRDGRAIKGVLAECPERFRTGAAVDLGQGDSCTVHRADGSPGPALLRNRSYEGQKRAGAQSERK